MSNPIPHPDQIYIDALLKNDGKLIHDIYEKYAGKVIAYIKQNNGQESDARDVIQETLIIIYQQASEKDLTLTCPFDAYFFLLCKRRWLNKLKNNTSIEVTIEDDLISIDDKREEMVTETERYELRVRIFEENFLELGKKCRELIQLTLQIKSMEVVAEKMGVTYAYVRKKKSLCMGQLTELVKKSKEFKNLKDL